MRARISGERTRPECWRRRPAFADFPDVSFRSSFTSSVPMRQGSSFRRDAETSTRDARAPRNSQPRRFSLGFRGAKSFSSTMPRFVPTTALALLLSLAGCSKKTPAPLATPPPAAGGSGVFFEQPASETRSASAAVGTNRSMAELNDFAPRKPSAKREFRVARSSRALVSASRRNELSKTVWRKETTDFTDDPDIQIPNPRHP